MRRFIFSSWLGCLAVCMCTVMVGAASNNAATKGNQKGKLPADFKFANPLWSPDGQYIALAKESSDGVYVYNVVNKSVALVTEETSSGCAYNWSPDSSMLGFKLLLPQSGGHPLQVPAVYRPVTKSVDYLHAAVRRCGVPSFSNTGLVAFTIDRDLWITDSSGKQIKTFDLGGYANLAPISPDGSMVAFNDNNDQIWVIDLATGAMTQLTDDDGGYCNPIWSPDSSKLVVSTIGGYLKTIEPATGQVYDLDEGRTPTWSTDSNTVFYCRIKRIPGLRVTNADLCTIGFNGTGASFLSNDPEFKASGRLSPAGNKIAYTSMHSGALTIAPVQSAAGRFTLGESQIVGAGAAVTSTKKTSEPSAPMAMLLTETPVTVSGTVPYINQCYDMASGFSGYWACGATSAMMGIQYYDILPTWDITCPYPTSHTSHYGKYVSAIYTFNDYTYNIPGDDPNGNPGYGGYGFIIQNNWANTPGYMAQYINNHGPSSTNDASSSWSKLQDEVNNSTPFVMLNMLTGGGHYILIIGYIQEQRTAIANDPYGNKNNGSYPNWYGESAYYDWPYYNNGYQNLGTVYNYIYCRATVNSPPTILAHPNNATIGSGDSADMRVVSTGPYPLTYQWQKNGTNISDGGHYSGCTTATMTVSSANTNDGAGYRCVVTNDNGSTTSNAGTLTVWPCNSAFLQNASFEGGNTGGVAESWTSYKRPTNPTSTWTIETASPPAGAGTKYQQIANTTASGGGGIRQDITNVTSGATYTFSGWMRTNSASATAQVRVSPTASTDWATAVALSPAQATSSSTWVQFSGSVTATGSSMTLWLDGHTGGSGLNKTVCFDDIKVAITACPEGVPTFTQQPSAQNVCPGSNASFSVAATGEGTLTYQWQKNSSNISNGGHYSGCTTETLTITGADTNDVADYRCKVTSSSGSANSNQAALTLKSATTVTTHPTNQSTTPGGSANFSVEATGEGTLTYQWQKSQTNISNGGHYSGCTTATLTISTADTNDAANYRCVVTGECSTATSNEASLTVSSCGTPVLTNGNFEYSTAGSPPYGWTTYIQASKTGAWSIQTASPPQGTQWQQTQVVNSYAYGGVRQNVTGLTSGSIYTISGAYRTNSTSATATIRYNLGGDTDRANSTVLASRSATTWGTFSADVTASGASLMLFLDNLNGSSASKVGAFDNIKVVCKP